MNTANSKTSQFSDSRLTIAAIFAFMPYSGVFGVHNFILKQYGKGIAHIIIFIVGYISRVITVTPCSNNNKICNVVIVTIYLQYLIVGSYIWAIVEGVQILRSKKQNVTLQSTTDNSNTASQLSSETIIKIEQDKKQDHKAWSILSIIATTIPILLWIFCFIISGVSSSENGPGAVWWFVIMYYWSLGIPLAILSIVFGIIGLKTSLRRLSIISLSLKAITIIAIALLFFAH